jgi:hypothetical protein
VKKNRNAETVELIIGTPARFSVKCNWKRRRSSLVAVSVRYREAFGSLIQRRQIASTSDSLYGRNQRVCA